MDSSSHDDEESRFFDAHEDIAQDLVVSSSFQLIRTGEYDTWIRFPQSVRERRMEFFKSMGLYPGEFNSENSIDKFTISCCFTGDIDRVMESSGAVLRTSLSIEEEFSSSRSSMSSWNTDDLDFTEGRDGTANFSCGSKCNAHGMVINERIGDISDMGFGNISQRFVEREIELNLDNTPRTTTKLKNRWLRKLQSVTCLMSSRHVKDDNLSGSIGTRIRRVKVRRSRKKLKEFSALFIRQDIKAHKGSIVAMKFSFDGKYLASAGEDKIVKIWQVVEDERSDIINVPDADPSCVYFSVNQESELTPLMVEKDCIKNSKNLRRTQDSACVVFPQKVFTIMEKPLHVYWGHSGDILDLSWSKNNFLLSSSVDKTVRLWLVGVDHCLKVFPHNDYVTCIQFNPVNDDHFISGSIDGKVRIWERDGSKVVEWTETRDIITAVSYRPDGQGGIIGSSTGTCRFFDLSDNQFHLGAQLGLTSKKKSPSKRITGFQFLPQDQSKILVTCADSKVRIIDGMNVIGKYKGLRSAGNQISASLTSDGKHIISASDDSNIYIWNYKDQETVSSFSQPKVIRSFECFSSDASIAIPWPGLKSGSHETSTNSSSSSTCFSLSQEYILDSSSKGTATWPEEKLPISGAHSVACRISKYQYKLFKTCCQSSSSSHAWGLVIVSSGWDGRIRSYHNYGLPVSL